MQVFFRHFGAASICALLALFGAISCPPWAAAAIGILYSVVITVLRTHGENKTAGFYDRDNEHSQVYFCVFLFQIALGTAVLGLPVVTESFLALIHFQYSLLGTPWWAALFFIMLFVIAFCIISKSHLRKVVFGEIRDPRVRQAIVPIVGETAALAGLTCMTLNLTGIRIDNGWLFACGWLALLITISYTSLAGLCKYCFGLVAQSQRFRNLREKYFPRPM